MKRNQTKSQLKTKQVDYHRNGISGEGFHVVKFTDAENGNMLGVVFPLQDGDSWNGRVAVFNLDMLAQGNITFGQNSWRGDDYESFLREAIAKQE